MIRSLINKSIISSSSSYLSSSLLLSNNNGIGASNCFLGKSSVSMMKMNINNNNIRSIDNIYGIGNLRFIHHNGIPLAKKQLKEVIVLQENIQCSPQKCNLVARQIRELPVNDALVELRFSKKMVSTVFMEAIARGIKKAYRQHKLTANDLTIGRAYIGKGRRFKRPLFSARGRASMMMTTQSRLTIHLHETRVHAGLEKPKISKQQQQEQQQNLTENKGKLSEADRKNAIVI